jgi:serine/threonine protein kinase
VVLGGIPTFAADSWALGCVTYQCLSGRPPFLEMDEESTRHRIVTFQGSDRPAESVSDPSSSPSPFGSLFEGKHASSIEGSARDLIERLLQRHPARRPSMPQVAQQPFFADADVDVFSLHRRSAYPLDVGRVAPAPDAQWSRRQYSSIWAPQPAAYDLSIPDESSASPFTATFGSISSTAPIPEGDEGPALFATRSSWGVPRNVPPARGLVPIQEAAS